MRIIKVDAIDSTNSYLRRLRAKEQVDDFTVVVTQLQTKGRGQMGTQWISQERKNLMFSVFKDVSFLKISESYYISIVVSLAIYMALELLQIKKLKVKWPNDILSDNKKLAGVLIENVIKQDRLQSSVIGIGVNINQTVFENLPNATSLRLSTGKVYELDEILNSILGQLKHYFSLLSSGKFSLLKEEYEKHLFRKNKPSTFKNDELGMFSGIIIGISESGNLQIILEGNVLKEFELKKITLLY